MVSYWEMTIDGVIRQVLRDVKRNDNPAMKGSMYKVSHVVSSWLSVGKERTRQTG